MEEQAPQEPALAVHPVYTRAKELVQKELDSDVDKGNEEVRANVIAALKEEFPKMADRIKDEGMLAQDITDTMSSVKIKAGFSDAVDQASKDLGL